MVDTKGRGPTSRVTENAPFEEAEVKVCGGTLKVTGFIKNVPCQFIIDTGVDVTILSSRLYEELNCTGEVEKMGTKGSLKGLDGQKIPVIGQTVLEITLGETVSKQQVWIARMQEDCILGADFLKNEGCVIDYPRQALHIGDTEIPMHQSNEELRSLRVILDKSVKVPGYTEMIIPAKVEGQLGGARWGTVGPPSLVRRNGDIIIGRTLVDLNKEYVPVRVVNTSSGRKKIRKGTELAICEPVASVTRRQPTSEEGESAPKEPLPDYLKPLFDMSVRNLSSEQGGKVSNLLTDYKDVFSKGQGDLGRASGVKHKIEMGDAVPLKQATRRIPIVKREEACKAMEEMERQGIVEPSTSPWSSPVVLVRKKDGTTRFCVDYSTTSLAKIRFRYHVYRCNPRCVKRSLLVFYTGFEKWLLASRA